MGYPSGGRAAVEQAARGAADRPAGAMEGTVARDALQEIPGVGPSIARDLRDLGVRRVADLKGRDPRAMYERLCALRGARVDRCMLYVLRCAVYYASRSRHDPALLLWWNWSDARRRRS